MSVPPARRVRVGDARGFDITEGFDEPTHMGNHLAGSLLATCDYRLKGWQRGERVVGGGTKPTQNSPQHFQVIGRDEAFIA